MAIKTELDSDERFFYLRLERYLKLIDSGHRRAAMAVGSEMYRWEKEFGRKRADKVWDYFRANLA